jgi:hypothetical protein
MEKLTMEHRIKGGRRAPSVQTLETHLRIPRNVAFAVRWWMKQAGDARNDVAKALGAINYLIRGHGVEGIRGRDMNPYWMDTNLAYVNMGDPYVATILFDVSNEQWHCADWGSIVEKQPDRFKEA